MKPFEWAAVAVMLAGIVVSAWVFTPHFLAWHADPYAMFRQSDLPSPHVKVQLAESHGSGAHIGNGYYVTAAHVVKSVDTVTLLNGAGKEVEAKVLWANTKLDIALLRAAPEFASAIHMSCRTPAPGERVTAYGNPMNFNFQQFRGYVAGASKKRGPWANVFSMDATILPGISGGAVMDSNGDMVGVAVGVLSVGFGGYTGLSLAVPASVVCMLMGKGDA